MSDIQLNLLIPDHRAVILPDDIDDLVVVELSRQLLQMAEASSDPVTIYIASNGGDALMSLSIIDLIGLLQTKYHIEVIGLVLGQAMSGAAFILQACDTRIALPNSIIMLHGPSGVTVGDARSLDAETQLTTKLRDIFLRLLVRKTATFSNYWEKVLMDSVPKYYTAQEALTAGLVDVVLSTS